MAYRDGISRCFFSVTFFLLLLILPANMTPIVSLNGMSHRSDVVVSELGRRGMIPAGTPHDSIAIDGDTNFTETALREGWPGNGSPEHPFIIDGLEIDCSGEFRPCISIRNTRSNFIISNCRLIGAGRESGWDAGVGIYLENVWYGEMVENIVEGNNQGIYLELSNNNNLINNTCNSNGGYNGEYDEWSEEYDVGGSGIRLYVSDSNTVVNNTCFNNTLHGFSLEWSDFNTVVNNTCLNNAECGIDVHYSHNNTLISNTCTNNFDCGIRIEGQDFANPGSNTIMNNTCNNNSAGIVLRWAHHSTVVNNICNRNDFGIRLPETYYSTVANNICSNNSDCGIILLSSDFNTVANNTCNSNDAYGISLQWSRANIITNNTLNGCGFSFGGLLDYCRQIEVTDNSVNTLPLVFLQDQVGNVVSSPAGQVILVGCSHVIVKDQTLMDCSVGILLCYTTLTTLVNNTCNSNGGYNGEYDEWGEEYDAGGSGIRLHESYSNTVTNNTCSGNGHYGIRLESAQQNTVANNTFNRNDIGISLQASDFNTLANNTCSSNTEHGISVRNSHNNTVISNTCNSNDIGIFLRESNNNTVANNICNNNRIGIELYESYSNIVANNTFVGNIEHDIVEDFEPEWGLDPVVLLLMGLVGITVLGVAWRETYRAYVSEGKKWREAHSEERTLPKADQEVLLAEERRRRALKEMYRDEINIPLGYRVVSWFGKRRALKHVDVDESLEDDSSDQ